MARAFVDKGAMLVAVIVTGILVPLAMLVAAAPSAQEASAGFTPVEPSAADVIIWTAITAATLLLTYVVAAALLRRSGPGSRTMQ